MKSTKTKKFTYYYIFFLFRNHWIGFQNRKDQSLHNMLVIGLVWFFMYVFFSILTYFLWCLLMMPSIFSIQLFVSARKSRKGKIRNQQKIRNYYIFSVSESWDWIPKPKINDRWVCMIYSFYYQFLHILLWCLLMMPSIFQFEKSPPTASKRVMPS